MSEGWEARVAVLEAKLERQGRDFDVLREECRDENENNQNIILRRMEQQEARQMADHREIMDKVNEQIGPDTRKYVAASTKKVEQEMQITAAGLDTPLWRQAWTAITGSKILTFLSLAVLAFLLNGFIKFLQELLVFINALLAKAGH